MTFNEFIALCSDFMIDPSIALENEGIYNALTNKDYSLVKQLLSTQF